MSHLFLFDWVDASNAERARGMADLLCFVLDVLSLPAAEGCGADFRLSAAGADGLAHLLTAVEQSLRFEVTLSKAPPPRQKEG